MTKFRFFCLLLILSLSTFSFANDSDIPLIAAYKPDGSLYIFGLEDEPIRVSDDSMLSYRNHLWSPDGTKLIFQHGNTPTGVYDLLTEQYWFLDIHIYDLRLMTFSLDGEYLIYTSEGNIEQDGVYPYDDDIYTYFPIVARRIRLKPDSQPELLGVIYYVGPYGGSGNCFANDFIAYERGWKEYNNVGHTMLVETPYGLLANGSLIVWDSDNNAEYLFGTSSLAEVSPSRTRLANRNSSDFDIISLETFDTAHYEIPFYPDYGFVWSQNEQSIYYSVRERGEDLLDTLEEEEQFLLEDWLCNYEYQSHTATIRQLNLSDGSDSELYRAPFYAIGSIMPDPQGDYLYFTAIPDAMPEWIERMLADDCEQACQELFYPDLYRLNLENGEVELILEDVIKATLNFAWE